MLDSEKARKIAKEAQKEQNCSLDIVDGLAGILKDILIEANNGNYELEIKHCHLNDDILSDLERRGFDVFCSEKDRDALRVVRIRW